MPQPRKKPQPPVDTEAAKIGPIIKLVRTRRGLSQAELADMVGVSREAIVAYEAGRVRLLDDMIARLARALTISADELLGIKKGEPSEDAEPSVRLVRRMQKIQKLPAAQQKALLKNIDMFLKAAEADITTS